MDGAVKADEYSFSKDFGQLILYVNRTADTLFLAVDWKTAGWEAIGLGSAKMDSATIFMGYVDADGKVQFAPQAGSGHSHSDTTKEVASTVVSYDLKTTGGTTTLEIALKADSYIKKGQSSLELIFARPHCA